MLHAFLVVVGAALWATDTLFRQPLTENLSSVTIVAFEHLFATVASFLWVMVSAPRSLFPGWRELFGACMIGALGSAMATVFFTESFLYVNPSVSVLLQKIQPVLVISLSTVFLRERPTRLFLVWAVIAIGSAYLLSFPEGVPEGSFANPSRSGVSLALLAAFFWAISTVIGKSVLAQTPAAVLSFWRFFSGGITLYVISRFSSQSRMEIPFVWAEPSVLKSIGAMALLPGFLGVLLYYYGLRRVRASTATILELSFPLCAIWVNSKALGFELQPMQVAAGLILAAAIVGIGLTANSAGPGNQSSIEKTASTS